MCVNAKDLEIPCSDVLHAVEAGMVALRSPSNTKRKPEVDWNKGPSLIDLQAFRLMVATGFVVWDRRIEHFVPHERVKLLSDNCAVFRKSARPR